MVRSFVILAEVFPQKKEGISFFIYFIKNSKGTVKSKAFYQDKIWEYMKTLKIFQMFNMTKIKELLTKFKFIST